MNITRQLSVLLLAAVLFLSACSGSSERANYIPADAVAVLKLNALQIGKKVMWESLMNGSVLDKADTSAFDFEQTGIDLTNVFYAYAASDQRLAQKAKLVLILPLKNAGKWQEYIKKEFPQAKIKEEGSLNLATDEASVAGWDKNTVIIAIDPGNTGSAEIGSILTEEVKKAFNLPKDQNIRSNKTFASLEKEAHDISLFANYEMIMDALPQAQLGMAGSLMASQRQYIKETYYTAGLDFEKGKIVADAKYYTNQKAMQLLKSIEPTQQDNDIIKKMPGNELNGVVSYHINPKGVMAFIDTMGYAGLIDGQLESAQLSTEEIINAFSGDFAFAVTDLRNEAEQRTYSNNDEEVTTTVNVPAADWLLAVKIANMASINKLLQLGMQSQLLQNGNNPDIYRAGDVTFSLKNNFLAVSNSESKLSQFATGSSNDWKIPDEVGANPFGIYADLKNSVKAVPDPQNDPANAAIVNDGKKMLESFLAYGGKAKDDHVPFHFELNFQNKSDNALMQIANFIKKAKATEEHATAPAL